MRTGHLGFILCGLSLLAGGISTADDFRIDTYVYVGTEKKPLTETITIFFEGRVYDFVLGEGGDMREITIYNPASGSFTLLDIERKQKSVTKTQDIFDYVFKIEEHAAKEAEGVFSEAAKPKFEIKSEEEGDSGERVTTLTLTGKLLRYKVTGRKPPKPEAVKSFHLFADQYARLNAVRPGNLPPGARLELNKALANAGILPSEIVRTISATNRLGKDMEVRSEHLINWSLSGADQKRITQAGEYVTSDEFKLIPFSEYRELALKPQSAKQAKK